MYDTLLAMHSVLRWFVFLSGLIAAVLALRAASSTVRPAPDASGLVFTILYDVQVLAGILLYVRFSPITTNALHHMGNAMANANTRFWAVEHPIGMIVGLVFAHLGRASMRAAAANPRRRRTAAIFFTLAWLAVVASMPWPFLPYGRPLL